MNKQKIAWITDSTAYITEDLSNHKDVFVLPLGIVFQDEVYEDGVNITTVELYKRITTEKHVPKTSQPSLGKFTQLFEKLKEEYDSAIAIHVSSELSGTLAACKTASELVQFPVEIVDSKSMSYAITTLLYKGMTLASQGESAQEIAQKLRTEANKSENYILLGSLDQFYKGGRMSGTQFLLGSLLQIKPIIRINRSGEFELFEKVRSEKKALQRMLELLAASFEKYQINQVQIMHGNNPSKAKDLEQEIKKLFPSLDTFIGEISNAIAVHAGEGTLALIWHNESKVV